MKKQVWRLSEGMRSPGALESCGRTDKLSTLALGHRFRSALRTKQPPVRELAGKRREVE